MAYCRARGRPAPAGARKPPRRRRSRWLRPPVRPWRRSRAFLGRGLEDCELQFRGRHDVVEHRQDLGVLGRLHERRSPHRARRGLESGETNGDLAMETSKESPMGGFSPQPIQTPDWLCTKNRVCTEFAKSAQKLQGVTRLMAGQRLIYRELTGESN